MDELLIRPCTWRGQGATLMRGSTHEAVLTTVGAQLACLREIDDLVNPLWRPHWPSVLPEQAGSEYGDPAERGLLATICGSNLCIDRFGAAWPGEHKPLHGEAGIQRWHCVHTRTDVRFSTWIPRAALQLERCIRLRGSTLELSTTVRHHGPDPRAIEWCEHTTLGDPFLAGARITAGIDGAWTAPWPASVQQRFAVAPLSAIDPAAALRPPHPIEPPCGDVVTAYIIQGWWQAENPGLGRRLRAEFSAIDFPWLAIWTEHRQRQAPPWAGVTRARGLELSSKPFPEGQPPAERQRQFHGHSTECWIPPGTQGRTNVIRLTWSRC